MAGQREDYERGQRRQEDEAAPPAPQAPLIPPLRRRSLIPVPKELLWPVCQRLSLILFVMCFAALGLRLHSMWRMGKLHVGWAHLGTRLSDINGTHFFLDIGSGNNGLEGFSHTKKLEDDGWRGVCADPFPDHARSCTTLAMPVTPKRGQYVQISDCSGHTDSKPNGGSQCTQKKRSGVSVLDVLKLTKAPHIIDYLNLDTEGSELAVLKTFPWKDFCVRSWTVQHRNESVVQDGTMDLLQGRNCRVTDTGSSHWARCSCSQFAPSLVEEEQAVVRKHSTQEKINVDFMRRDREHSRHWEGIQEALEIASSAGVASQ